MQLLDQVEHKISTLNTVGYLTLKHLRSVQVLNLVSHLIFRRLNM